MKFSTLLYLVDHYVKDMRRVLEESELTEKRAFLRGFVKRIDVIDREGIMTYVMPINGVMKERMGVLPTVNYGGWYWTVPELFFERKEFIPALQQLLLSYLKPTR